MNTARRSAGFQPAVSPTSSRQSVIRDLPCPCFRALAGWKPAILQTRSLRYSGSLRRLLQVVSLRRGDRISYLLSLLLLALHAPSQTVSDQQLAQIRFDQKLNTQISSELSFRDDQGQAVRFGHYFGQKPLVLMLGYYQCPMLCTLVLNGFIQSASGIQPTIGREFDVITVSINPAETPALAAAKKRAYMRTYGRSGSMEGWHALTGDDTAIRQLAGEVGFHYAYDSVSKQFAHPSGLIILTPEGKISHYLFGVNFSSQELSDSLREASARHAGSPMHQLILLCFHYNPLTGKYSSLILVILRLLGAATILGLFSFVIRFRCQKAQLSAPKNTLAPNRLQHMTPDT